MRDAQGRTAAKHDTLALIEPGIPFSQAWPNLPKSLCIMTRISSTCTGPLESSERLWTLRHLAGQMKWKNLVAFSEGAKMRLQATGGLRAVVRCCEISLYAMVQRSSALDWSVLAKAREDGAFLKVPPYSNEFFPFQAYSL
jgi:hypothetical protein